MDARPRERVRERMFTALFYRITLNYARTVPQSARRLIEFLLLVKAITLFLVLIYIHGVFSKRPTNCLKDIEHEWPKDGVLRVEIISNASKDYTLKESYEKEYGSLQYNYLYEDFNKTVDTAPINETSRNDMLEMLQFQEIPRSQNVTNETAEPEQPNQTENETQHSSFAFLTGSTAEFELLAQAVWPDERYIVEYSLEYGFLRLSPKTRRKLNITVMLRVLDPDSDECFGDWPSKFIMDEFLGYDDVLMSSIKFLAEKDSNRGYFRNVVTNEHYRFVSIWMERSSYVAAALVMLIFTLSISMLLRFSHHQILVFIIDLLNMIETNTAIAVPAAPLLTVILALVGMEAIMSEFFNDTVTAFYIIIIVWLADQYDVICSHTRITRRYWLRFFFLYHFAFYAYHYRFNGQYSSLALVTSWLFIQHSMVYFFHHYEIPAVVQQGTVHTVAATVNIHEHQRAPDRRPDQPPLNQAASSAGADPNEQPSATQPEPPTDANTTQTSSSTRQLSDLTDLDISTPLHTEYTPSTASASSDIVLDRSLGDSTISELLGGQSIQPGGVRMRHAPSNSNEYEAHTDS